MDETQQKAARSNLCQKRLYGMNRASYRALENIHRALVSSREDEKDFPTRRERSCRRGRREDHRSKSRGRRCLQDAEISLYRMAR